MSETLAILGGRPVVDQSLKVRWPIVTDEDRRAVMRVLEEGPLWALSTDDGLFAPEMTALEREFAAFLGVRHALACNGGTAALHMALAAAGVGPGDEVITSAFSFLATPAAVLHQSAVPIFADIDPRTFNIDPSDVERRITSRTKAIVPVHIHGVPADMDAVNALARRHGLVVIEDACQAPGARYKGRRTGSLGDMAAFSLNGTKNFAVGEGGLFVTNDETFRARANMVRMVGETLPPSDRTMEFQHLIAWNYRTQEMPSALGRSQLRRLDANNAQARANGEALTRRLTGVPGVEPPYIPPDCEAIYHKYRIRLRPSDLGLAVGGAAFRDLVQAALAAEGVDVVRWLQAPLPAHPIFQRREGYGRGYPWSIAHADLRYDAAAYPRTQELIDNSLVICSELNPIYCQPPRLIEQYGDAIVKVFSQPDALLSAAASPARTHA
ncbi:MAG: DegT/DnrJ/EryC1/StrS family aminotransferase [Betaproteobacteria bacterium]